MIPQTIFQNDVATIVAIGLKCIFSPELFHLLFFLTTLDLYHRILKFRVELSYLEY